MLLLAVVLAVVWGVVWAAFLQWTTLGKFLALQRTWLTVVVGVGGDVLIMLLAMDFADWWRALAIIAASSVGIVGRSLWNELQEMQEVMDGYADAAIE